MNFYEIATPIGEIDVHPIYLVPRSGTKLRHHSIAGDADAVM